MTPTVASTESILARFEEIKAAIVARIPEARAVCPAAELSHGGLQWRLFAHVADVCQMGTGASPEEAIDALVAKFAAPPPSRIRSTPTSLVAHSDLAEEVAAS